MQSAADDTKSLCRPHAEPGPTDICRVVGREGLAPHGAPGGLHVDFCTEKALIRREI